MYGRALWCYPGFFLHIISLSTFASQFEVFTSELAKVSDAASLPTSLKKNHTSWPFFFSCSSFSCTDAPTSNHLQSRLRFRALCYMRNINLPKKSAPHVQKMYWVVLICGHALWIILGVSVCERKIWYDANCNNPYTHILTPVNRLLTRNSLIFLLKAQLSHQNSFGLKETYDAFIVFLPSNVLYHFLWM